LDRSKQPAIQTAIAKIAISSDSYAASTLRVLLIDVKARWLLANLARHTARAQLAVGHQRLLDFGCGTGLFLQVLSHLGFAGMLQGCDISSGMLAEAIST